MISGSYKAHTLQKYRLIVLRLLAIFILASLVILATPVRADQTATNQYSDGADIVFVVDQSGSMSGASGRAPSDPFQLRADAVRYVIERLGIMKLYFNQQSRYRIGVVSFGDSARVDLHLAEISAVSADGWSQERMNLQSTVVADRLGFTNVAEGLRVASELFNQADPIPGNRARVVIVLTDGLPDLQDGPDETDDPAAYFQYTLLPQIMGQFPAPDYRFYVVAIDDINDFWSITEPYWLQAVTNRGRAQRLAGSTEMPKVFTEILDDFIATQAQKLEPGKPFAMPPYLQRVIFTILKSDPNAGATIIRPDQTALVQGGDVDIRNNGPLIQLVEVSRPVPGQWNITVDSSTRYDIYFEPVQANIQLIEPSRAQAQNTEINLVFQVRDTGGIPLPEAEGYPLKLHATIEAPGGKLPSIELTRGPNDTYQTEKPILLSRNGDWRVEVTATANGNPVLQPGTSTFSVFSTNRADLVLETPSDGVETQIRSEVNGPITPLAIEVRLLNDRNQPLSVSEVFPMPADQAITATLRRNDDAVVQQVALTETEPGVLTASIPGLGAGDFSLEVITSDQTNQSYVLAPTARSQTHSFKRREHPGQAQAELIRTLSIGVPSVLLALILIWLIYTFSGRMNGRLVVLSGAKSLGSFELPRRRSAAWKQPPPITGLESIKTRSRGKNKIEISYREINQRTWRKREIDPEQDIPVGPVYNLKYTRK